MLLGNQRNPNVTLALERFVVLQVLTIQRFFFSGFRVRVKLVCFVAN